MITHVARVVLIVLEVLVLFNLLIVVHELGHFLAARWRGLYIEKFGVWFGKPIWKKTINGVQYSLGSLPFGGFVALPQLAPMDIIEGKADVEREKLPRISAIDKIIVAFAGPFYLQDDGLIGVRLDKISQSDWMKNMNPVIAADHITWL